MAIQERTVKNKRNASGELTGKAGTVYDVNIKSLSQNKGQRYKNITQEDIHQACTEYLADYYEPGWNPYPTPCDQCPAKLRRHCKWHTVRPQTAIFWKKQGIHVE